MRVFVYYNLHKKCWSIKALEGNQKGRVVAHANAVDLKDCQFQVSEAGRQRVIREKRKNVHAGVAGELMAFDGKKTRAGHDCNKYMPGWYTYIGPKLGDPIGITYNPYKMQTFQNYNSFEPVHRADNVLCGYKKNVFAYNPS